MKFLIKVACIILITNSLYAQAPSNYYNGTEGKTGNLLKVALHNIIKGHSQQTYNQLWTHFYTTDRKANGKVWDMYSDRPGLNPPYEYAFGSDQCSGSSNNVENYCYNREHSWPKSKFNNNYPMTSDLFLVIPTDSWVNSKRSNYPYGEVSNPIWVSQNGSKVGLNTYSGAPNSQSFEPIDSFKGDLARGYFYIATRYYSQDNGWSNWEMANGADLKPWAIDMLIQWHEQDPVSQKEIDRNNAIYTIQGNRNPYIDHPGFVQCVFKGEGCTSVSVEELESSPQTTIFPNPANNTIRIDNENLSPNATYEIWNMQGKQLSEQQALPEFGIINLQNLLKGVYFLKVCDLDKIEYLKLIKN